MLICFFLKVDFKKNTIDRVKGRKSESLVIPDFCLKILPHGAILIDWVTAELPLLHPPLESGLICKIKPDGDLEWASPCRVLVQGSHEASVTVRSVGADGNGHATHLLFSGNPSKYLQGHNIFGSDDLVSLMSDTYRRLCKALKLIPQARDIKRIDGGDYALKMVDINYSYELPSRHDVLAWLRAGEYSSRTRRGRPEMKGSTLYWGKSSTRWAIKAYSKGEEIEQPKHRLPEALQQTPLEAWADNKLRIELRLKTKELQKNDILKASDLTPGKAKELFFNYQGRIEMKAQIPLSRPEQLNLPKRLRATYVLWLDGQDVRHLLSKPTFYRHRKELKEYGIDISVIKRDPDKQNVIPLLTVLEAKPASIPSWAFDKGLVHYSAVGT